MSPRPWRAREGHDVILMSCFRRGIWYLSLSEGPRVYLKFDMRRSALTRDMAEIVLLIFHLVLVCNTSEILTPSANHDFLISSFVYILPSFPFKKTCWFGSLTWATIDPRFDYSVNANHAEKFYPEIRKYDMNLKDGSLEPVYLGNRPKLSGPYQSLVDFVIQVISQFSLSQCSPTFSFDSVVCMRC
jgi:hypothetical protein